LKIQDGGGRHLEKSKNHHIISAAVQVISTNLAEISKIKDGGGRHLEL